MDEEMNLASKIGGPRGKLKRLPRGRTGVGMEKPVGHDKVIGEGSVLAERGEQVADDFNVRPGVDTGDEIDAPDVIADLGREAEGNMEEDEAFLDLVNRMEGESASAGRARKRREAMRRPGNDSLRAEFADRLK